MQGRKAIWGWLARLPELFRVFVCLAAVVVIIAPLTARAQGAREYLNTPVDQWSGYVELMFTRAQSATSADLPLPNDLAVSRVTVPYLLYSVPLSSDDGETRAKAAGLAKCPFGHSEFAVKDGREVKLTNSPFGADYPVVEGVAHPIADTAGYSPFGFGYRRCPGELMTVNFIKEFLKRVWAEKLSFVTLDIEDPDLVPTNPKNVLIDNIAFTKTT